MPDRQFRRSARGMRPHQNAEIAARSGKQLCAALRSDELEARPCTDVPGVIDFVEEKRNKIGEVVYMKVREQDVGFGDGPGRLWPNSRATRGRNQAAALVCDDEVARSRARGIILVPEPRIVNRMAPY
jgi:hypothetical protein